MAEAKATGASVGARETGKTRSRVDRSAQAKRPARPGLPLSNPRVLASVAILSAVTFSAEYFLPRGIWAGALHIAVVFLGIWLARPREILVLGGVATWLVIAGAILTLPPVALTSLDGLVATLAQGPELANRFIVILGLWALAGALYGAKRRELALRSRLIQETARRQASETELERQHGIPRPAPLPERLWNDKDLGHEVRTLLNAIIGFSEAAKQELFGPHSDTRYRDYMVHINTSGWSLLRVFEGNLAADPLPDKVSEPGARRPPDGEPEQAEAREEPPEEAPNDGVPKAVNQ